jgi:2-deoxy-D-gluconate 3-dehydrogenase
MDTKSIQELVSLNSKTAIVTGGSVGIGQGIARRLHEAGANVVIVDKDKSGAESLAAELNRLRSNSALGIAADVSLASDVKVFVAATKDRFGSIDVLVNNAGIFPFATLNDLTEDTFDSILAVNLKGVFLSTKHVSEIMKSQGGGRIINITSIDAIHPSMAGLAAYDASKHGVWGYTKNIALELAKDKIYVNALAPGGINTPGVARMSGGTVDTDSFAKSVPMGRMGEPDDIARATLFLASDLASYITGAQLVVDGGVLLT